MKFLWYTVAVVGAGSTNKGTPRRGTDRYSEEEHEERQGVHDGVGVEQGRGAAAHLGPFLLSGRDREAVGGLRPLQAGRQRPRLPLRRVLHGGADEGAGAGQDDLGG